MSRSDLARLITLAAIWGASFLFMRIIAPVLGPLWTAELRAAIAGGFMLAFIVLTRRQMDFRHNWKIYLLIGTFNSALPFALFSYAALMLPSGYSAIVNATSPLWGALIGAVILGEKLNGRKLSGLIAGVAGVAFLVRLGPAQFNDRLLLAVLACLGASFCYGIGGVYTKKKSAGIAAPMLATGSQLAAALIIMPFLPIAPIRAEVTPLILMIISLLALLCTAIAYFIYFRLISEIGPTKALTVTFLIPLFALVWGYLLLHETINLSTLIGCALVVLATWLVLFQPRIKPETQTA